MAPGSDPSFTELLGRSRAGDRSAFDQLIPLVYEQLRGLAAKCLASETPGITVRATELVHEAYLRLAGTPIAYEGRSHFFGIAARQMRQILVDFARARKANKRGGEYARVTLEEGLAVSESDLADLIGIDRALTDLAEIDPRKSEAVELVYFGGLTRPEAAEAMGVSEATLDRELRFARAWLYKNLGAASA